MGEFDCSDYSQTRPFIYRPRNTSQGITSLIFFFRMFELEKVAENVSDMLSSESKVLRKTLEGAEEDDVLTTASPLPSEDNAQLNSTTARTPVTSVDTTDGSKTSSSEEIYTDRDDFNPFSGG